MQCTYCGKECKNPNSLRNHERLCKSNPNRQLTPYEKGIDTFATCRKSGSIKQAGQEAMDDIHNRQCPHCSRWFKSSQLGGHINYCSKSHGEERYVTLGKGVMLDITWNDLEAYRKEHTVCEICGKAVDEVVKYEGKFASKRLCVDHNHTTNKFRGMLCQVCNRQLGWYEKYQNSINEYLNK